MKVIGRGAGGSFLCEMNGQEMTSLLAPRWSDGGHEARVGDEVDVLNRLSPTLKFEEDRKIIPLMAADIRAAADKLEKAFEGM